MAYRCELTLKMHGGEFRFYPVALYATKRDCTLTAPFYIEGCTGQLAHALGHRNFEITAKLVAAT